MKQCTKCNEWKKEAAFYKEKKGKNGLRSKCKSCSILDFKRYYNTNKEEMNKKSIEYKKNNPDRIRAIARNWRKINIENCRAYGRKNYQKHRAKILEYQKKYGKQNREEISIRRRKYTQKNKTKRNEYVKQCRKDPMVKLKHYISTVIRHSLRGNKNGQKWEILVGYTLQDLRKHLEKLFESGMNWQNHGIWHIDHIIPIYVFNFDKPEDIDFHRCWALSNLRPLWGDQNMSKNRKLIKSFRPSFIF